MIYYLMYKDIKVLSYDSDTYNTKLLAPFNVPYSYNADLSPADNFIIFCNERILMMNRVYCKELLIGCKIDNQSAINICLLSNGLSFKDCYWIKEENSINTWDSINLYENEFNSKIADIALTGEVVIIDENIFTGELNSKGTRAKCYIRNNDGIQLFKHMTSKEILAECISSYIADAINIKSTKYSPVIYKDLNCSVCNLFTDKNNELISCRDVILHYGDSGKYDYNSKAYNFFKKKCCDDFLKMQIFDYLTLNTDRNRDNYGIIYCNNKIKGFCPLFDHDSCFKGKSTAAIYFVTGVSFDDTLNLLKMEHNFETIIKNISFDYLESKKFYDIMNRILPEDVNGFYNRLKTLKNCI